MEENRVLDAETVRKLVRLVEENALAELTIEEGDCAITLKAEGLMQGVVVPAALPRPTDGAEADDGRPRAQVKAPMTGVFYRAPAPGEPPFVEPGDHIEVGQVIGLIEAMKVFSEVPSEVAGRVVEIPAKNAELVHQDQALVVVALEE